MRPILREEVLHELVGDPSLQNRLKEIEAEHKDIEAERLQNLRVKSVEELEFSVRTSNVLRDACITTIGQLADKADSDLLKHRNFGRKCLKEVREILNDFGFPPRVD